jgi:hypothetical protein
MWSSAGARGRGGRSGFSRRLIDEKEQGKGFPLSPESIRQGLPPVHRSRYRLRHSLPPKAEDLRCRAEVPNGSGRGARGLEGWGWGTLKQGRWGGWETGWQKGI